MIEHDNIFYIEYISALGGVETFVYEMVKKYQEYDIAVVCKQIAPNQLKRLNKLCPVYVHKNEKIKCKTIITNYDNSILDYTEAECICETIHADYTNKLYTSYPEIDERVDHWLGITKYVCKTFTEKFGVKTELCYNPLDIGEIGEKPLILLSATRLSAIKGVGRMKALKDELDRRGINYVWFIFSNDDKIQGENIIYRKPSMDIKKWINMADYLVQLSDSEALSYSINEALMIGTPVIVTPLPYLDEIGVKDGVNSYILNFDLSNLSEVVDRIHNVPKFKFELPKDNYDKYVVRKKKSNYKEVLKMKVKVECIKEYTSLCGEGNDRNQVKKGDVFEVTRERANELLEEPALIKILDDTNVVEETTEPEEEVTEEVVQAVANAIVEEATEQGKEIEEVVEEIVEESKEDETTEESTEEVEETETTEEETTEPAVEEETVEEKEESSETENKKAKSTKKNK